MTSKTHLVRAVLGVTVLCSTPPVFAQDPAGAGAPHAAMADGGTCPVTGEVVGRAAPPEIMSNRDWWPDRLDLSILRQNAAKSDPMGADFDYAAEFSKLDLDAVKRDIEEVMTTSQDWWPADWGHYGPLAR